MSKPNISELFKNFNQNQIKEINDFLSSSKGKQLKNNLSEADKRRLSEQFSKLNPSDVQNAVKNMSRDDIIRIINKL